MQEELEIQSIFPTYIYEDYAQFIDEHDLNIRKTPTLLTQQSDVIQDEEFKFITDNFINLMQNFTNVQYEQNVVGTVESVEYVNIIKDRLEIFFKIFCKYKGALNGEVDEAFYSSYAFIFGAEQYQIDNNINLSRASYNYYKDSNIPELLNCSDIMNDIEVKVISQLQLYPDHATLNDVSVPNYTLF